MDLWTPPRAKFVKMAMPRTRQASPCALGASFWNGAQRMGYASKVTRALGVQNVNQIGT